MTYVSARCLLSSANTCQNEHGWTYEYLANTSNHNGNGPITNCTVNNKRCLSDEGCNNSNADDTNKEQEDETSSSSEKALAVAEEKKSSSPMLAEVIEAAVTKSSSETESEKNEDGTMDPLAAALDAEIIEENEAITEGKEGEEVRA